MQSILEKDGLNAGKILGIASDFVSGAAKNTPKSKDNTYLGGSISKYTKDLVMTFPTMFDTSLSPATAGMISKANERNIVTMLQLLFGAMQIEAQGGKEAIKKVHNNLSTDNPDLLDIYNAIDNMTEQATGGIIHGIKVSDAINEMTAYLKSRQKAYPVNSLNEKSISDYMVFKDPRFGKNIIREASTPQRDYYDYKRQENDDARLELQKDKDARETEQNERERNKAHRDEQLASIAKVMTDQDYRKANELAPTLMIITFNEVDGKGNLVGKSSFAAGVKSRLIPVESSDIIERLAAKKNTALNFVNFIRATTGEISFTKDFLFAIQQNKILAKNAAKRGPAAKMWNVLDSRHVKNNKNAYNKQGNDASAITTLVINQETVNMLKKEYNFDVENFKTAKYIMEEYNLLGLIVCDESIETAKILYHGNDSFETISYTFLNRENDNSKAYKDVINLMNKTGR